MRDRLSLQLDLWAQKNYLEFDAKDPANVNDTEEEAFDLAAALGASDASSPQLLTLYIPNKDLDGREFGTQRLWVLEAARLLAEFGGGVTILPPCEGGWWNEASRQIIWEAPVIVYTYVKTDAFLRGLPRLRLPRHARSTS